MLDEILMNDDIRQIIVILSSAAGGFFMGAEWGVKRERKFIAYMLDRLGLRVLHPDGNLKRREEMEIVFHLEEKKETV